MTDAPVGQGFGSTCKLCRTLPTGDLIELDLLMGDAGRWPSTVWGIFKPPKGHMTPARQRFGAVVMGNNWLVENGHAGEFTEKQVRDHYRYDVTVVAASLEDLVNRGVIEAGARKNSAMTSSADQLDAAAFLTYFDRGIKLGNRGLELLSTRLEDMVSKGQEVPLPVLKMVVELGLKLSTTQAQIKARGLSLGETDDEDEGFRTGSGAPSVRMGHHRIRTIEGEARVVADQGPADRARYNEGAEQDASPKLPAP